MGTLSTARLIALGGVSRGDVQAVDVQLHFSAMNEQCGDVFRAGRFFYNSDEKNIII